MSICTRIRPPRRTFPAEPWVIPRHHLCSSDQTSQAKAIGHGTKHPCSLNWSWPKKLIICDGSGGWRLPNRKLSITNFFKTWWSYIKLPDPFGLPQRQRQYCGWFWALGSLSGCMAALLYEIKWIDLLAVGLISHMRQSIIYMTHKIIGGNNHSFAYAIRRKK